jgi:hypothetical protein
LHARTFSGQTVQAAQVAVERGHVCRPTNPSPCATPSKPSAGARWRSDVQPPLGLGIFLVFLIWPCARPRVPSRARPPVPPKSTARRHPLVIIGQAHEAVQAEAGQALEAGQGVAAQTASRLVLHVRVHRVAAVAGQGSTVEKEAPPGGEQGLVRTRPWGGAGPVQGGYDLGL